MTNADLEKLIADFGSVLSHTSVSGAAPLGDLFGFEFGVLAGIVDTPGINSISKAIDSTAEVETLPHATLFGAISFPLGLTAELNIVPSIEAEDVEFKTTSLGLKWTYSKLLPVPLDLAVRGSVTKSELSFTQDNPSAGTVVTYEGSTTELMFLASKNFILVEPFVGLGYVTTDGEIGATADIFQDASIPGLSASKKESGMHYMVGANLNLLFFKLGLEAGKILDSQKVSAKASFYF